MIGLSFPFHLNPSARGPTFPSSPGLLYWTVYASRACFLPALPPPPLYSHSSFKAFFVSGPSYLSQCSSFLLPLLDFLFLFLRARFSNLFFGCRPLFLGGECHLLLVALFCSSCPCPPLKEVRCLFFFTHFSWHRRILFPPPSSLWFPSAAFQKNFPSFWFPLIFLFPTPPFFCLVPLSGNPCVLLAFSFHPPATNSMSPSPLFSPAFEGFQHPRPSPPDPRWPL